MAGAKPNGQATATQRRVEWQAERYDALADPHELWAGEILDRLTVRGGERILDAGCGSGRITRLLCERLIAAGSDWSVLAVDASKAMVEKAGTSLAEYESSVEIQQADLVGLDLSERGGDEPWRQPVDAVFSCAVFHWIADHRLLFERAYSWLKPGGRLVAQCGGAGNVADWDQAAMAAMAEPEFRGSFEGWEGPWNFAGADETVARLSQAGFSVSECWLEEKAGTVVDGRAYLEVVGLAAHLDRLPENLRERFVDAVLQGVDDPNNLHYIRLNIEAVRPDTGAGVTA